MTATGRREGRAIGTAVGSRLDAGTGKDESSHLSTVTFDGRFANLKICKL